MIFFRKLTHSAVSLIFSAYFLALPAFAEDTQPPSDNPPATVVEVQTESAAQAEADELGEAQPVSEESAVTTQPGNITIDFKDADIQNVLRILAFKSGVNIVAGKDVAGSVTIRLVDVPWEKALEVILKTYGYAYDRQENVIRVSTIENSKKEDLSTEVFTLNYSRASDVEKSVKEILSDRGKIRSDSRSNTLIITDMPTSLQKIRTVISRLDAATPQVLIQSKVIELTLGKADKLGFDWQGKIALTGSKRPTSFPFPSTMRTQLSNFFPYGRGTTTGAIVASGAAQTTTIEDFPKGKDGGAIQPTFPVADKVDFTFGSVDFSEMKAVFELLAQKNDAKILSEPHVMVLNNQEAKILVGEVIAIPTFERNGNTGRMEITGYEDRDMGIRLAVTPQVNATDEIVVTIHPEITTLVGYDDLTEDIKAPRFQTREAMTNVRIKSGQTIAIGGLIREDTQNRSSKFPFLGDVPLLGKIFSYQSTEVVKTDLLFFMTVTVVKDIVPQGHTL